MARPDILECVHEPFGDAFYYGPERLSPRFANDPIAREESGFAASTYETIFTRISNTIKNNPTKRIFIKDIIHYLSPPSSQPASIAPSLSSVADTSTTPNPTVVPLPLLQQFHFTFLIRHPRRAIPSYYRCTIPPLSAVTGFDYFLPSEAGYDELRRIFDYLVAEGVVGPHISGREGAPKPGEVSITVIDADDLLDHPEEVVRAYCKEVGIDFKQEMLEWDDESNKRAKEAFEKWNGFHDDAIGSTSLKAREGGKKEVSREEEDAKWREKFGEEAARVIRETADANVKDYEYLKGFAMKI